jgi:hypothetical protein
LQAESLCALVSARPDWSTINQRTDAMKPEVIRYLKQCLKTKAINANVQRKQEQKEPPRIIRAAARVDA